MKKNALPLQKEVLEYLMVKLQANLMKFERKAPGYDDVISLCEKSGLPVLSRIRVETKLKKISRK